MFASTTLRQLRPMSAASLAPAFRAAAIRPQAQSSKQVAMMARRWNTQENKGGKPKLVSTVLPISYSERKRRGEDAAPKGEGWVKEG